MSSLYLTHHITERRKNEPRQHEENHTKSIGESEEGGRMSEDVEQMEAMLRLMFGDHYVSMFHVIDDDMIRKPVFQSQKIKSYENGDSVFKVTVNWRLLNKLRKEL